MDILLFAAAICALTGLRFAGSTFHENYLDKTQTGNINGIFVILVFFRHFLEDKPPVPLSLATKALNSGSFQFIVVPFLFFSGYGVMTSITAKGANYIKHMPRYRILRIWLHFALAIVLYLIRNELIHEPRGWKNNLLAFTALVNIGCSYWYVFTILFLYAMTYAMYVRAEKLHKRFPQSRLNTNEWLVVLIFAACIFYIIIFSAFHMDIVFSNTALFYPLGMGFCLKKNNFEDFLWQNNRRYWTAGSIVAAVYVTVNGIVLAMWFMSGKNSMIYQHPSVVLAIGIPLMTLLVMLSMKCRLKSKVLSFLGNHVFDVYIMQRIPMKLCKLYLSGNWFVCFWLCAVSTLLLAVLFHRITEKLDILLGLSRPDKPQTTTACK